MSALCLACRAGWAIALVSLGLFALFGRSIASIQASNPRARPTVGVAVLLFGLLALASAGAVGCAVQGSVCEARP